MGRNPLLLPRLQSIRARLTVWLALLIVLCMTAFAVYLYAAVAATLTANVDRTLRVQGQQVASTYDFGALDTADQSTGQDQGGQHVDIGAIDQFSTGGVFVETFDTQGHLLARSQNLGRLHLPAEAQAASLAAAPAQIVTENVAGEGVRVYSLPAVQDGAHVGLVLVALSLHDVTATTQTLLTLLAAGTTGVVLLVIIVASVLVRRGLRPLDEMATIAEGVTARRLDQRLKMREAPAEVARLAMTFDDMLDRLDDAFATQRRFVADASHELRTPLAILQGQSEVLLLDSALDAHTRAGLSMMRDEAGRMGRMVANLLLVARGDAGRAIDRRPVELDVLLAEVAGQARMLSRGQRVSLACQDRATLLGDGDLLKQALLNLVDNALTHTPSGGHVELRLTVDGQRALLAVRDTGSGIAPEHLPHLFERFYRVDRSRSRRSGGAGLGLSIVEWVARSHGGSVAVESAVGHGSTFTLLLPNFSPSSPSSPRPENL